MFDCKHKSGYRYEKEGRQGNYRDQDWITWYEDFTFEFNSRESYLEWRTWWKKEYKRISQEIRVARSELKSEAKSQAAETIASGHTYVYYDLDSEVSTLMGLRREANRFMYALRAAKKEAARQVEAERKAA